jgi:hypothetical protein
MSINVTSPVTGATVAGLTSPTYTTAVDIYPGGVNGRQYAVTALGGTQTGVRAHAVSDPFTTAFTRPVTPKALQSPNPVTGRYGNVAKNVYSQVTRKGTNYAANQAPEISLARQYFEIPSGSDSYDAPNVRALVSFHLGAAAQQSSGLADMLINGVL